MSALNYYLHRIWRRNIRWCLLGMILPVTYFKRVPTNSYSNIPRFSSLKKIMYKSVLLLLTLFILVGCNKTAKNEKNNEEMQLYEPSEMALLMRQMYEFNKLTKSQIINKDSFSILFFIFQLKNSIFKKWIFTISKMLSLLVFLWLL